MDMCIGMCVDMCVDMCSPENQAQALFDNPATKHEAATFFNALQACLYTCLCTCQTHVQAHFNAPWACALALCMLARVLRGMGRASSVAG